jgi:hypothetical protein
MNDAMKATTSQGTNRRQFLQAAAGSSLGLLAGGCRSTQEAIDLNPGTELPKPAAGLSAIPASSGVASKFWIDPSIAAWRPSPWRKVHIEYHTSRHMPRLAERFDADEFGDRLLAAHVNGATVFAKDMYGYSYFPNTHGRMHPNLSFDLLGKQVAALRQRKIQVLAYFMLTWNPELAERHPEWLVVHNPGDKSRPKIEEISEEQKAFMNTLKPAGPQSKTIAASKPAQPPAEDKGFRPYMWQFCIGQEGFIKGELDLIRELVSKYELDGVWLDGGSSPSCYCDECVRQLREQGLDPLNAGVQYQHKAELCQSFLKRIRQVIKETRPGCLVCPQNQGSFYGLAQRVPLVDYSSQEALFTDAQHYGYHYFPTVIRYARGYGIPFHGCTVIFKDFWADFGGLKSPGQMHTEVAACVSQGARCDIGDQVPPDGRLDPAVYHVIGQAYQHIERIEPYLEQAVPVTEAALLASGDAPCNEVNYGWVKLLNESKVQFDIVERDMKWEDRYALVVLPENLWVDQALASRLQAFIAAGGAAMVAHHSGLVAGTEKSWLEPYGLHYAGRSPFTPAYMVPRVNFTGDIPSYAYALYEGASQWRAESPAATIAVLGEPLFQRSPDHYQSHLQTPFDHTTPYAALARSGQVGLIAFPLGQGYYNQGFWIYRQAFQKVLSEVLPVPLIQSDAHLSTELSLTHQAAKPSVRRKERYLVHIVNYSPVRKSPKHTDFYDDPIPLHNVTVRLNLPLKTGTAKALYAGQELPVRRATSGGMEVLVPRVDIHEVVCFELS